jgi:hypothetical protein
MHLPGDRQETPAVVPGAWIDDTIRGAPDGAYAFAAGDNPPGYPNGAHYRNGWWVRDPAVPFFHASGINGSTCSSMSRPRRSSRSCQLGPSR